MNFVCIENSEIRIDFVSSTYLDLKAPGGRCLRTLDHAPPEVSKAHQAGDF